MNKYGYTLYVNGQAAQKPRGRYYRRDLELMSGRQLREICRREKIIHGVVSPLDKDDLIRVILRYRGADENLLIKYHEKRARDVMQKNNELLK